MMLLATFMSAIYGYNLSARSDYDRDVAKKRAMAVIYKFNHQHVAVVNAIKHGIDVTKSENLEKDITFPMPESKFYGDYNAPGNCNAIDGKEIGRTLFYRSPFKEGNYPLCSGQGEYTGGYYPLYLTTETLEKEPIVDWLKNYKSDNLSLGRSLFDKNEMVSKLVCFDNFDDAPDIAFNKMREEPYKDDDHNYIRSYCEEASRMVVVSYMALDPRWLDKVTNDISLDFWSALATQPFRNNIGIIKWGSMEKAYEGDPDEGESGWVFTGKIGYPESYRKEKDAWENDPKNQHEDGTLKNYFPISRQRKFKWNLPPIFRNQDFFSVWAMPEIAFCEKDGIPCLFRISDVK